MLLTDLVIDRSYRSNKNNMVKDFYNPVLSTAITYKRAVGYFTLSSLINASQGLTKLIENGGKVEIIASPKLTSEDIETITLGYKMKNDVYLDALIRELSDINSNSIKEKLNYIATLIADNRLDIKIALMDDYSAYHEKFGLVEDIMGNSIMFTGSMNETENGQYRNFESFVVFKSWDPEGKEYISDYKINFADLWENKTERLSVIPFPDVLRNKLIEFKKEKIVSEDYIDEDKDEIKEEIPDNTKNKYPKLPEWFKPFPYQDTAIKNWTNNNYNGLLAMATGTGKTLTGLYGLTTLYNDKKRLASIIVCPYQHLVEQWVEDVREFNINPVICYSNYDWKPALHDKIKWLNNGTIDNLTIVTTNSSFCLDDMQAFINSIQCEKLILVDEAHNAGSNQMMNRLNTQYKYRLGLSATPRRYKDDEATDFIYRYFGGEVFSYSLQTAIENNFLTKYYYYPHLISLTEDEQEKYNELSLKIAQNIKEENGKVILNDYAKNLLIKRARLVAGATNKLSLLRDLMKSCRDTNYMLVYCGATKTTDDQDFSYDEERQIEKVCRILGNEYGITNRKFTAAESADDRKEIIEMFSDGRTLQAIVAIKCLDEGVNIPAIQHAFIMASNTDPKEFIQRRGRVLRKYEKNGIKKEFAYIHDFVTIPATHDGAKLVETELKRVYEFNSLAENKLENEEMIDNLVYEYNIDKQNIIEVTDQFSIGGIDEDE